MAFAATRQVSTPTRKGLLSDGWDFGFGLGGFFEGGFDWGTFGGLFPPIIEVLRESSPAPVPPVISEIPTEWPEWSLEPILETRPGHIPDPYPGSEAAGNVDPSAIIGPYQGPDTSEQQEDQVVAHDWGHLLRQGVTGIFGLDTPEAFAGPGPQTPAQTQAWLGGGGGAAAPPGDCDGMAWSGSPPPKGYKVVRDSCGNAVLRKVRRRRRRRMLTNSDKDDIASIVSMVGKGAMASSLINGAMRR